MKNSQRIAFIFLILSIFNIAAFPISHNRDDGPTTSIQIVRFSDGTSSITDNDYGFRFNTPPGWYPISLPITKEEKEEFDLIRQEKNLPITSDWISNLGQEEMQLAFIDLESMHYGNGSILQSVLVSTNVTQFAPSGLIEPIMAFAKLGSNGSITSDKIIQVSGQKVGVIEFSIKTDDKYSFAGYSILFIRRGMLFMYFNSISCQGYENCQNYLPNLQLLTENILVSLEFFENKQ